MTATGLEPAHLATGPMPVDVVPPSPGFSSQALYRLSYAAESGSPGRDSFTSMGVVGVPELPR